MHGIILKGPQAKEPLYPHSVGIRLYKLLGQYAKTDNIAFLDVVSKTSLTYKDLYERAIKVAIYLQSLGFSGQTIAICSENRIEFFIPVIAALYLGCPVTTINHRYTENELLHVCEVVKPAFIFSSKQMYPLFKKLQNTHSINYLQQIQSFENFNNIYKGVKEVEEFKPIDVNAKEQIAAMLFSSGTTGMPKAVMITHMNLSFAHRQLSDQTYIIGQADNNLICLPFYHGYGFNFVLGALIKGNTVKFMDKFDPVVFLCSIEKYKISYLTMVPPLMVFLAKHPLVDNYDLSSVKTILCAGAACSKELEICVLNRLKHIPNIYQGYGLTESALALSSFPAEHAPRDGSVGKIVSDVEIKFRDPETNETLGINEVGEICARGPMVMKGYYGNPVATRDTITSDGWLLTGDLGYCDEEGYIYIVDRLKELIKYKGFQVPPAELEAVLLTHPKIMDVGVVGLPDEAAGELPLAFVVKKPGMELNEQEVKDFIKGQVSYAKQLHGGVRFIEIIPKSPAGKILRRELRNLLKKSKL